MKRLVIAIVVLLITTVKLSAQEDDFDLDSLLETIEEPKTLIKLKGEHYFQYHFPLKGGSYDTFIKAPKFINEFKLQVFHRNIEVVSEWELRGVMDKSGEWGKLSDYKIGKNYIKWNKEKFNLAFGYQVYKWGVADEFNPTNNLNPKNYEKGYESEEIPILSVSGKYYPNENTSVEAVFIPFEQNDEYFFSYADEVPSAMFGKYSYKNIPSGSAPQFLVNNSDKNVNVKNLEYNPKSVIAGIKANYYSNSFDFSVSYVYDVDPYYSPEIKLEKYSLEAGNSSMLQSAYKTAEINLVRNRIHRLGFDIKTIYDKYGIWTEVCYSFTNDKNRLEYKKRKNELSIVTGLDFRYGPNDRFYINLQYTGRLVKDYYSGFFSDYSNGLPDTDFINDHSYMEKYFYRGLVQNLRMQSEKYLQGILAQFEWSFYDETIKPVLNVYYTLPGGYDENEKKRYGSLLLNPELEYDNGEAFKIQLGANLAYSWYKDKISGEIKSNDRADLIGYLNPFNNIYLKVSYEWNFNSEK